MPRTRILNIASARFFMKTVNLIGWQAESDRVSESEWSELLDHFADANIYQTWSYGSVRWGAKNLSHLIVKQNSQVVAAAQVRIVRPSKFKLGLAYLRWGPLCQLRGSDLDPSVVQAMVDALRAEYVEKRGLYLEILPNAFLDSRRAEIFQTAFRQFNSERGMTGAKYRTLVLDLQPSIEELRKKLDKKWRNQLNASERNGLRIVESDNLQDYDVFCKLYDQMWERKQFDTTVKTDEFRRIQQQLPDSQRMRIMICLHREEPVAGIVGSQMGDSAIYLLGATNEGGRNLKAAYLLHWAMIRSLKEKQVRYYDLGGINPATNPGVYHFKIGFNGADVSHMSPVVACDNKLSAAFVKLGKVARGGFRRFQPRFGHA
jgi:lipid II:glycine glycyltransferase (peptidoglycan interpeptide bridge formation enzyme)